MREDDFATFSETMRDLCTAFNRPYTDDLVRVYFDSLKDLSVPLLTRRAKLLSKIGKKFPAPYELRPQKMPEQFNKPDEETLQQQLMAFSAKKYHRKIPDGQFSMPWIYKYREYHDTEGKRACECVAIEIPALGDSPGKRVTVDDMRMDFAA